MVFALSNHNKDLSMPPPCRGNVTAKFFYKTRLCDKYREGTRPYDSNCNFAHGIEDLRRPPPNWQEIVGPRVYDSNWDEDLKIITRYKLCKNFYYEKVCPFGERCNYLHEAPEKFREEFGKFRESSVISISTAGTSFDNGARSDHSDAINTAYFNVDTNCMNSQHYDSRDEDLEIITRHKLCKNFYYEKVCPFSESSVLSISSAGTSFDNEARSDHSDAINTAYSNVDTNSVNSEHYDLKWDEDLKFITRHKLCKKFYYEKVCPYGERCNYLHEDPKKFREESGKFWESSGLSISTAGTSFNNRARSDHSDAINTAYSNVNTNCVNSKYVSWKTKMCNKWWETSGNCPFGDKCRFAHGLADCNSIRLPGDGTCLTEWRNGRDELALIDNDPRMQSFVETLVNDKGCQNLQGGERGGRLVSQEENRGLFNGFQIEIYINLYVTD